MDHDYLILYGDASFTLRREMPEGWGTPTGVNISIDDSGGDALLTATAATITSATTISADATRGRRTITVAAGTWEPDDLLRIADSDDGPPEDVRVESFDAATKIVTLERRLEHSHASGAAVTARWMTYALDASAAAWANLVEGSILWDPDTDDQAIRNTFTVSTKTFAPAGLEDDFRQLYPAEHDDLPEGSWAFYEGTAIDELDEFYKGRGRSFRDLVSESSSTRLILAQVAWLVAVGTDKSEARQTALENNLAAKKASFEVLRHWFDDDQDDIEEDDEVGTLDMPLPNRRW